MPRSPCRPGRGRRQFRPRGAALAATGERWAACVDRDGWAAVAAHASPSERLRLPIAEVRHLESSKAQVGPLSVRSAGGAAELARASFVERWEPMGDGLAQSRAFAQHREGRGDLLVVVEQGGSLVAHAEAAGLSFACCCC